MKATIFAFSFVLIFCLCHQANANCNFEGKDLTVGAHTIDCKSVKCQENGFITVNECGEKDPPCYEGKKNIIPGDKSKSWPDCCDRSECKDL